MSILDDVTQWAAPDGTRPPPLRWNGTAWQFAAFTVHADGSTLPEPDELAIRYAGDVPLPESLVFNFAYPVAADDADVSLAFSIDGGPLELEEIGPGVLSITVDLPPGTSTFAWEIVAIEAGD